MFCSLSGSVPIAPVFSPSGHVYEKDLIIKYINENGKDPVTNQDLSVDNLVDLKLAPKFITPRPPTATSLPSLLNLFQSEWDSIMLETFSLKQQYNTLRQELSNAYYEVDAAKRVIARLVKERDEARRALVEVREGLKKSNLSTAQVATGEGMDVDDEPVTVVVGGDKLPSDVVGKIEEVSKELSKGRMKRKKPATLAPPESFSTFMEKKTFENVAGTGIVSLDYLPSMNLVLAGGKDGTASIYNWQNGGDGSDDGIVQKFKTGKKGSQVLFHVSPSFTYNQGMFSVADKTVKLWNLAEGIKKPKEVWSIKGVEGMISVHPTGETLLMTSTDGWGLIGIEHGKTIASGAGGSPMSVIKPHPDGILFATTSQNNLQIWDIRQSTSASAQPVQQFTGHGKSISDFSFSENGFYLSSVDVGGEVRVWDLRDRSGVVVGEGSGGECEGKVEFDFAAKYLAVGHSGGIKIYNNKTWNLLGSYEKVYETADISGLKWGNDAKYLVSAAGGSEKKIVVLGI